MSEGAFQWVIALGVTLCWVTTLATAWSMFNIVRAVKRLEEKVNPVVDRAGPILDSAKAKMDEARPKIQDMIVRADEIVVSARDQMTRLESLVTEATDSARLQIERIDI